MRDRGGEVDFGEAEADGLGDGEGVDAGATVAFGETAGAAVGVGLVPPDDNVLDVFEDHENAPAAMSFSRAAAVRTSPALKLPSDFVAGSVAVGAWPTGIGSYCSSTAGLISLPFK